MLRLVNFKKTDISNFTMAPEDIRPFSQKILREQISEGWKELYHTVKLTCCTNKNFFGDKPFMFRYLYTPVIFLYNVYISMSHWYKLPMILFFERKPSRLAHPFKQTLRKVGSCNLVSAGNKKKFIRLLFLEFQSIEGPL